MRASRASIPSPSPLPSRCHSSRRQPRKNRKLQAGPRTDRIPTPKSSSTSKLAAAMGISSMPEPRDSLLGFLVYNAVISIAGLVRAALVFLDLGEAAADGEDRLVSAAGPDQGVVERLQRAILAARRLGPIPGVATTCGAAAAAAAGGDGCSVCLAGFEAEAVVNRLPCGHHFHRGCLETWLGYERATCPLCRAHVPVPADDTPGLRYPGCELD